MKNIFIYCLIISLYISSCDLFTTRPAEEPDEPGNNFQIATRPEELISNLQKSLEEKVVENYIICFSEDKFVFAPSAGSTINPSLQDWDINSEEQYFRNMISLIDQKSKITLEILEDEPINRTADSAFYSANYLLNVPFTSNQYPKSYRGILHFTMIQDSSLQWTIKSWRDIKEENFSSWSELKGRMY